MCIHPRCKAKVFFELQDTAWGKSVEVCRHHGPLYNRMGGGKLVKVKMEIRIHKPTKAEE